MACLKRKNPPGEGGFGEISGKLRHRRAIFAMLSRALGWLLRDHRDVRDNLMVRTWLQVNIRIRCRIVYDES